MTGYFVGSGFYDQPSFSPSDVETRFGRATVWKGGSAHHPVALIARHGPSHTRLSHQVQHRANLLALKQVGAAAIVSCSVCGVVPPDWPIGQPLLAEEIYYPSNRLPSGEVCTIFDQPGKRWRGHLIASSLLHPGPYPGLNVPRNQHLRP